MLHDRGVMLTPRCQQRYRQRTSSDEESHRERVSFDGYVSELRPLASDDGLHFRRVSDAVISGDGTGHRDFIQGLEDLRIVRQNSR